GGAVLGRAQVERVIPRTLGAEDVVRDMRPRHRRRAEIHPAGLDIHAGEDRVVAGRAGPLDRIPETDGVEMRHVANPERANEEDVVPADHRFAKRPLLRRLSRARLAPGLEAAEYRAPEVVAEARLAVRHRVGP